MRILLILLVFVSLNAVASQDKELTELFKKYDLIMDQHKTELIDEVFTQKFLNGSGGKKEFEAKVKDLPVEKNPVDRKLTYRKGARDEVWFARLEEPSTDKTKKAPLGPEFIIVKENGKFKITGTISDGE